MLGAALVIALLPAGGAPPDPAPPAAGIPFSVDAAHSHVGFSVRHLGLSRVRGSFGEVSGALLWDADSPVDGSITVLIGAASLDTRNQRRDDDLRENFFETGRFPTIAFQSTGVEATPDGLNVHGILRIKDVSRPVTLAARGPGERVDPANGERRVAFEARLTIDRRDFGVRSEGHPAEVRLVIGYEVEIEIEIEAVVPGYSDAAYPGGEESAAAVLERESAADPGLDFGIRWAELRADAAAQRDFEPRGLALLGFKLLERGDARAAVRAFELYASEAGEPAASTHEWLGHAYADAGRRADALASYRRALALDPGRAGSIEMLRYLESARGQWSVPVEAVGPRAG